MAEEERLTKAERRERARAERKRKEEEAQQRAKRQRLTSILVTALVLAGIGAVVYTALSGDDEGPIEDTILVSSAEVDEARGAAGCEVVADTPLPDSSHHDPASAPPADAMYSSSVRPPHSGPHFSSTHPVVPFSGDQLDERALTHNLEHGAVIAWFDPAQVDSSTMDEIGAWSTRLNNSGFDTRGGAAIFAAAYEDPGISSGKAIAFRAWGFALDCDEWDETVANGFVIDRYGTHGIAPERAFAPYPEQLLRYDDRDVEDNTEAPTEQETGAGASPSPTGAGTTTDGATTGETETPTEGTTE